MTRRVPTTRRPALYLPAEASGAGGGICRRPAVHRVGWQRRRVSLPAATNGRARTRRMAPPVLVRQVRNGVEESVHRGDIVEVDVDGRLLRGLGDPDHVANLRSCVKPFGLTSLIEAGGIAEFE